ncbi:MAG: MobA/MobL family protein [Oscillospiraceae bacterium]|nr:MobA/MobL family protein [Oscillospiraceae bacterium]
MEVPYTAIYHLEAEIITRGEGRSAVAASAYRSGAKMENEYDGVLHNYTRKRGIAHQEIMLPLNAPAEWQDREKLWNDVETAEKSATSRLAREFNAALPVELSMEEWIPMLREFIQKNFVDLGMAADFSIHNIDPNNPHVHIMLTLRPLDEKGKWQAKTQKEYLCVKDGVEHGFTAEEYKTAQNEGWEKQYLYKVGNKKVYKTPSAAEEQGISNQRTSKYPKCTKYGRQNPITEQWNSEEQLKLWRKGWEIAVNAALEKASRPERVDCRSFKDRGIDEIPTIHEGTAARMIEKRGGISELCEINRQIRASNNELRRLKAQMKQIADTVKTTVKKLPSIFEIADSLERLRFSLITMAYITVLSTLW